MSDFDQDLKRLLSEEDEAFITDAMDEVGVLQDCFAKLQRTRPQHELDGFSRDYDFLRPFVFLCLEVFPSSNHQRPNHVCCHGCHDEYGAMYPQIMV